MVTTTFDTGVHYLFLANPPIKLHCTEVRLHFIQISGKGTGGEESETDFKINIMKITVMNNHFNFCCLLIPKHIIQQEFSVEIPNI